MSKLEEIQARCAYARAAITRIEKLPPASCYQNQTTDAITFHATMSFDKMVAEAIEPFIADIEYLLGEVSAKNKEAAWYKEMFDFAVNEGNNKDDEISELTAKIKIVNDTAKCLSEQRDNAVSKWNETNGELDEERRERGVVRERNRKTVDDFTKELESIKNQNQHNLNCYVKEHDENKRLTKELEQYKNVFDNPAQAQYILSGYQNYMQMERKGWRPCTDCKYHGDAPSHQKCCGCARMYKDHYVRKYNESGANQP